MTTSSEFLSVIAHIEACTGDSRAWVRGLSPTDLGIAATVSVLPESPDLAAVVTKIRANHPSLFDPKTGVPITPSAPPPAPPEPSAPSGVQEGAAATALRKAESDLAQQNSSTATLDLLVISAILNAHSAAGQGSAELRALQREIDEAVHSRTDLDTPAGARDFQRFLIGKMRQIGAVVQNTDLDDRSKAALATAWTALYESSKQVNPPSAEPRTGPPPQSAGPRTESAPQSGNTQPASVQELPAYGADLPLDPLSGLDPAWSSDPLPPAPTTAPAPPAIPMPATLPAAALPTGGGFPGGLPTGLSMPKPDEGLGPLTPRTPALDDAALEDLLAGEEAAAGPEGDDPAEDEGADGNAEEDHPSSPEQNSPPSTTVRLPDGEQIAAPSPAMASVLRAALAGTPITEAFHQAGIAIPPPGTTVAQPVDPARIVAGDVGMFTDRQALAIDRHRALFDGQIRPVTAVSGPSFLGWLHPPDAGSAAPGAATTPNGAAVPAPTRPAAVAGSAG